MIYVACCWFLVAGCFINQQFATDFLRHLADLAGKASNQNFF
jgi:hypothetical protein